MNEQDAWRVRLFPLLLVACEAASRPDTTSAATWREADQAPPPWQVLVEADADAEVDPADPKALHVAVAPELSAFVVDGANALLAAGAASADADPLQAVATAQELMALIAQADAVAVASASVGDEHVSPSGAMMRDVTFETIEVLRGTPPASYSTRRRTEGTHATCVSTVPKDGAQHLMFFEIDAGVPRLLSERGANSIVDGVVVGWPSILPSIEQLKTALSNAKAGGL